VQLSPGKSPEAEIGQRITSLRTLILLRFVPVKALLRSVPLVFGWLLLLRHVSFQFLHPLRRSAASLRVYSLKGGKRSFNLFPLVVKFLESFVDVHLPASIVAGMRAAGCNAQRRAS
jgi:hypothetical protein